MTRVVSDTGPLLHLSEAQALHLLRLVGDTRIPPQVLSEIIERSDTEAFLDRLAASSLWVSRRILAEARSALDRIFDS